MVSGEPDAAVRPAQTETVGRGPRPGFRRMPPPLSRSAGSVVESGLPDHRKIAGRFTQLQA